MWVLSLIGGVVVLILNGAWFLRWRRPGDYDIADRRSLLKVVSVKFLVDTVTMLGLVVLIHLVILAAYRH